MTAHRTRHHLSHCHTMALVQCGVGINTTQHRTTPHYLDIVQQRNLETLLSAVLCGVSAVIAKHRTNWYNNISTTYGVLVRCAVEIALPLYAEESETTLL